MRILQIIDKLDIGGAERVFVDMCNILQEHQQDVTALFLLEGGLLNEKLNSKITFLELNRLNKWSFIKLKECAEILKQYDVIHCHFRHVYRYIALVKKIFFIKSKIILHDHYGSIDIDKSVPFLFDSFLKPDYYIGVSKSLTEWAETKLKVAPENIFLLENIIIQHKSKQQLAERYDLILVSNIKKVKNNLFGVKIAAQINKSLLLVGQNQDNTYFQKTKSEIKTDNIVINSDITEVQTILHNAQLGLHTSISETGPLVLIEYLAQGLPFLAYETGEVAKILKPHFPEYFIDNFNIEEWKKRLELIMNSVPDTQKMEEVFERYFGQTQYYKKLENIYRCISG